MTNVILCGGSGTRLWPLSRTLMPKQFIRLFNGKSLFDLTLRRNMHAQKTIIVCNEAHYFLALDECGSKKIDKFILEPFGKNTAAAITFAALCCDEDEILLVTPSDHLIENEAEYKKALLIAQSYASQGFLATFGIKPNEPNTGYGYIKADKNGDVERFIEKPNLETATKFIKEGGYYFNSGMFCFKAGVFLSEMKKYAPSIVKDVTAAIEGSANEPNLLKISPNFMDKIEDISIDYALMQKSLNIKMVPLDAGWSDMGSFDELSKKIKNIGESLQIDSSENFILTKKPTALVDVQNLLVVDTKDALLIAKKGSSQKVKEVYKHFLNSLPEICEAHTSVYRPWGSYEVLGEGSGYKMKKIVVKPGKRLSLQKHLYRSEHWTVVSGVATVTVRGEIRLVESNESTYIKAGEVHRLANNGNMPVILIEVQVGEYVGEDDIIRVEDDFDRN